MSESFDSGEELNVNLNQSNNQHVKYTGANVHKKVDDLHDIVHNSVEKGDIAVVFAKQRVLVSKLHIS